MRGADRGILRAVLPVLVASGCFGSLDRGVFDVVTADGDAIDAEALDGDVPEGDGPDDAWVCEAGPDACTCTTTPDCATYEDEDRCNGTLACRAGVCAIDPATVVECDRIGDSPCRRNTCVPTTGLCELQPVEDGTACTDGGWCTATDSCVSGECLGAGTPCLVGGCIGGCDEDADRCVPAPEGTSCRPARDECDAAEACDGASLVCPADAGTPDGTSCDDSLYCTGTDRCAGFRCVGAGGPCAVDEICNEAAERCESGSGCRIAGTDYAAGAADPANGCRACVPATSTTGWTALPDFSTCSLVTTPDRAYDICVAGACVSPGCGDESCNPPGPSFPLADTNQRTCYASSGSQPCVGTGGAAGCGTEPLCGQDAQYGWDLTHSETERFTRTEPVAGEPLATDNATGLVWQGCVSGLSGSSCLAGAVATATFAEALAGCEALRWGGFEDWRLPSRWELLSIVDFGREDPAIDTAAFPATPPEKQRTLSATVDTATTWSVDFGAPTVETMADRTPVRYRCVRGALAAPAAGPRYARTEPVVDEPIVTDAATGLVWLGCPAGLRGATCTGGDAASLIWQEALSFCELLSWAGDDDWYVPNIGELATLVDDRRESPIVDPAVFPGLSGAWLWSSTSRPASPAVAHVVNIGTGSGAAVGKATDRGFFCIRRTR